MQNLTRDQYEKKYGAIPGGISQNPAKRQNIFSRVLSDIPQDTKQIGTDVISSFTQGVDTANEARQQVTEGEISPEAGTAKTIGGGLQAGARSIGALVSGLIRLPFTQEAENQAGQVVAAGAEKVAETQIVQDTVNRYNELSPENKAIVDGVLGTTEGLATMLGAGPAAKITGKAITSPIPALKVGFQKLEQAADEIKPINLSGAEGIQKSIDLGISPESLMQRVVRVSKSKQTKFKDLSKTKANPEGESVGEYLVARNVFGTPDEVVDQLYKRFKDSRERKTASLATVQGEFKAPQVTTALQQLIERDAKISTTNAPHPDSRRIEVLFKKNASKGLTLSEVDEVKSIYERNIKLDYLRENAATGIEQANAIDSSLRNLVEDKASKAGIDTVRELNKETQLARQLMDDIGAEYAGQAGNNAVGLTDSIFLAEALGSSNPMAAAGFIVKRGLGNKYVASRLAKQLSPNAGSKEALPAIPKNQKLTGYLKFLEETNQNAQ